MTEIQNEYCIGFQLPKSVKLLTEKFASKLEDDFSDFANKLKERMPHVKLKAPFMANKNELKKLFYALNKFSENQNPVDLRFDTILFFDEEKIALSVSETGEDYMHFDEMQIDLCFILSQIFPERVSPEIEPVFIPRVTLGFYPETGIGRFENFANQLFEDFKFSDFTISEITLFERQKIDGARWRPKVTFKLEKKVPAII
jgi:hypothetical protein